MSTKRWHQADKDKAHEIIFQTVDELLLRQAPLRGAQLEWLGLYLGRTVTAGGTSGQIHLGRTKRFRRDLKHNVVRSAINTFISRICAMNRPRPQVLTRGGNWEQHVKSRQLTKWLEAAFENERIYLENQKAMKDGMWSGDGYIKVVADYVREKISAERVFPLRVLVDDDAAIETAPIEWFELSNLPIETVAAEYEKADKDLLEAARHAVSGEDSVGVVTTDLVCIVEGWALELGELRRGRHVVCTSNATLIDEEWGTHSPFCVVHWEDGVIGFHGQGIAEEGENKQREIDEALGKIQRNLRLHAQTHIIKPRACNIPSEWLNNKEGTVWEYDGPTPPDIKMPDPLSAQLVEYPWVLERKFYDQIGLSELTAQGRKPAGLDSGAAIREYQDVQTQRHAAPERVWEQLNLDVAEGMIRAARELTEAGVDLRQWYRDRNSVEEIDFKSVQLPEDSINLAVFPTSILPKTPAGKLAMIQELVGAGYLDREQALSLLDLPDLEQYRNLAVARLDDIHWTLDEILYHGRYHKPDPMQALEIGIKWVEATYLYARMHKAPEERMEMLLDWRLDAEALLDAQKRQAAQREVAMMAAAQPQTQAQPGIVPPGVPSAPIGQPPVKSMPAPLPSGGSGIPPAMA